MKMPKDPDWYRQAAEKESDSEISAGLGGPHLPACPPAYGGCTCSCHRIPGIMHVVACCHPTEKDEEFEKLCRDIEFRRERNRDS